MREAQHTSVEGRVGTEMGQEEQNRKGKQGMRKKERKGKQRKKKKWKRDKRNEKGTEREFDRRWLMNYSHLSILSLIIICKNIYTLTYTCKNKLDHRVGVHQHLKNLNEVVEHQKYMQNSSVIHNSHRRKRSNVC